MHRTENDKNCHILSSRLKHVCLIRLLAPSYKRKTREEVCYYSLHDSLPGMSPQVLFGNVLQTGILERGETLATIFRQLQSKFADVFQFWLGSVPEAETGRLF